MTQAKWSSQQDEIALGAKMLRLSTRSESENSCCWPIYMHMLKSVFGRPILDEMKITGRHLGFLGFDEIFLFHEICMTGIQFKI
jgi:hypothetical protein